MSSVSQHRLDHRAAILADKIKHRLAVYVEMLHPPGTQTPFTSQLTNEDALAFWRKHRFSPIGKDVIAGWQPHQVMALDSWLAQNPDPSLRGGGQYGALGEPLNPRAVGEFFETNGR